MDGELLTIQELAARLKVSARTLYRLRKAGLVPARLVGCQERFVWHEVVDALPKPTVPQSTMRKMVPVCDLVPMLKDRVRQMRRFR